jgi:mono/diheme cytochrome c family protein
LLPRDRILVSLVLLLLLVLTLACNPNPQPGALTPIPTLAPAAELTLIPSLEEAPVTGGAAATSVPAEGGTATEGEAALSPAGDPANGAVVFENCVACHGADAQGGPVGPTLVSAEMKAKDDDHYREVITNGIAGTAMPPWSGTLSAQDIEDVIAFLRSKQ